MQKRLIKTKDNHLGETQDKRLQTVQDIHSLILPYLQLQHIYSSLFAEKRERNLFSDKQDSEK